LASRRKVHVAKRPVEDREKEQERPAVQEGIPQPVNQTPLLISAAELRVTFKHEIG
jgi:hypothetical protein